MLDTSTARRLNALLPAQEIVKLVYRLPQKGCLSNTVVAARHPASKEDLIEIGALLGQVHVNFQILNSDQLPSNPKVGDVIVDATSTYQIRKVEILWLGTVADCLVLRNVDACTPN